MYNNIDVETNTGDIMYNKIYPKYVCKLFNIPLGTADVVGSLLTKRLHELSTWCRNAAIQGTHEHDMSVANLVGSDYFKSHGIDVAEFTILSRIQSLRYRLFNALSAVANALSYVTRRNPVVIPPPDLLLAFKDAATIYIPLIYEEYYKLPVPVQLDIHNVLPRKSLLLDEMLESTEITPVEIEAAVWSVLPAQRWKSTVCDNDSTSGAAIANIPSVVTLTKVDSEYANEAEKPVDGENEIARLASYFKAQGIFAESHTLVPLYDDFVVGIHTTVQLRSNGHCAHQVAIAVDCGHDGICRLVTKST